MKNGKIILRIFVISVLIVIFLVSIGYIVFKSLEKNINENSKPMEEVLNNIQVTPTETESERQLQLKELQKENKDIVAWLEIEGTNISYPIVQGEDNEFYMNHDYLKQKSERGSLFLDKDYSFKHHYDNLLIYGHNNQDGSMFATLMKYKKEDYYKEHQKIRFTTDSEDAEYEIIAAFYSRVYYTHETNMFRYYYFLDAENEQQFNEYVQSAKKASVYDTGKTAQYGDQLLTLSTCSYHTEDGRFVVVAKKSQIKKPKYHENRVDNYINLLYILFVKYCKEK